MTAGADMGLRCWWHQVLKWMLLLCTFHKTVLGQNSLGPAYRNSGRHCTAAHQCRSGAGEVCFWFYDGCAHGSCMCDPRSQFPDGNGKCRTVKYGDQTCYRGDKCPDRMKCLGGKCRCQTGRMTDDGRFCLREHEKLLGQSCSPYQDVCFQATISGYHARMVSCSSDGVCRCKTGFKQERNSCRRWNIAEGGCSRDHHCHGGALCVDKQCMCPTHYVPVNDNSKCAKEGAKYGLHLGTRCDEVNELRYCAAGLVCHRCPHQEQYTCVKYIESQTYNSALLGAGSERKVTILCVVVGVAAAVLFIVIS